MSSTCLFEIAFRNKVASLETPEAKLRRRRLELAHYLCVEYERRQKEFEKAELRLLEEGIESKKIEEEMMKANLRRQGLKKNKRHLESLQEEMFFKFGIY